MMNPDSHYLAALAAQIRDLAIELEHLAKGRPPALDEAPRLELWRLAHRSIPTLTGRVRGHPILGDQREMHTSQLFAMDTDAGWARTFSRFYRLGTPWDGPLPGSSIFGDT